MKFLLIGGSGMLGTAVYDLYTKLGHQVVSTSLRPIDSWTSYLDIRDQHKVFEMVAKHQPDWVFNLAALTDVEYCENHPEEAQATNKYGPKNVAKATSFFDIPMVHISTAGVFDGSGDRAYTEYDTPIPVNEYGKSKYAGEFLVSQLNKKSYIFRAGWMMGSGSRDKKFVRKILRQYYAGSKKIYGLSDVYGCPTFVRDFASGILKSISNNLEYGLYHMVSNGSCTRYDVAKAIFEILGISDVDVVPVTGSYFNKNYFAPRPVNEVIENKKLNDLNMNPMRDWKEALEDYLLNFYPIDSVQDTHECKLVEKFSSPSYRSDIPLVSIVTTAYKNKEFNKKYFDSVKAQTYPNIEVIFVDNMSPDDTTEDAVEKTKDGKVITSKTNDGCAAGNNLGARHATGKYLFFMGPDAWADSNCVEELVNRAEESAGSNTVLSAFQYTYDGSGVISCGVATDILGYPLRTYTRDGSVQLRQVFYADGSGIFITRENYIKLGMMDERTFLFAEDVDLSWKSHMFGLQVLPVKQAKLYHFSGGAVGIGGYPKGGSYVTNTHRRFLAERNMISNLLKNYSLLSLIWVLPLYVLINLAEMAALLVTKQGETIKDTYIKAYVWNINNFYKTMEKRRYVQKNRTKNDLYVFKHMNFVPAKLMALLEIGMPKIVKK